MLKLLFFLHLFLIIDSAPETRERKVFQVETRRHASQAEQLIREGRLEEFVATRKLKINQQANTEAVHHQSLRDYKDGLYVAEVKLGTPPQTFSLMIETGSTDLWVVDASCDSKYEQDCMGQPSSGYTKHRFDASASSTFKNSTTSWLEQYGASFAGGTIGNDVIELAEMKFASQGFGVARMITPDFGLMQIDGVLGLSWPALSAYKLVSPVWNMLDQMDQPIFTMFMARNQKQMDTTSAMDGGRITFGGFDDEKCENQINYVPLNSNRYWQVKMDDFSIAKWQAHQSYSEVIFDSSYAYIAGPPEAVNYILVGTGGSWDSKYQMYTLPCEGSKPDMVFKIEGIDYRVPPFEYVLDYGLPDGKCVLAVTGAPERPDKQTWIIGAPFMRQFCLVHDIGKERIGFARSINKDKNSGSSSSIFVILVSALFSRFVL